jgi:hypothetical protein
MMAGGDMAAAVVDERKRHAGGGEIALGTSPRRTIRSFRAPT